MILNKRLYDVEKFRDVDASWTRDHLDVRGERYYFRLFCIQAQTPWSVESQVRRMASVDEVLQVSFFHQRLEARLNLFQIAAPFENRTFDIDQAIMRHAADAQ